MTDQEIGQIWADNYPKSGNNQEALRTCGAICRLIREKTRLVISLGTAGTLQPVLDACGIPKAEFGEVEKKLPRR
jgi:hypothetical protein